MERDVPALEGTGSVFYQRGTTDEKSLDWPERTGGRARRPSSEERNGPAYILTTSTHSLN